MEIRIAHSEQDLTAALSVMRHLRPHLDEATIAAVIAREGNFSTYQFAALWDEGRVVAVAGFHHGRNLAWGRFLYVDDLVTEPTERSKGHGKALLAWLHDHARENHCAELHLDSGTQRRDAHRFYEREGMDMTSLHFRTKLA